MNQQSSWVDQQKVMIPKIRRILPGLIAKEIVGVQPMTLPQDLAILSSAMVIFKRAVVNADGVQFKFHPIIGRDCVTQLLAIKVSYFGKGHLGNPPEEISVGELFIDVNGLSETQVNTFIEEAISVLINRIDDLTIVESFNLKAGIKLLEETKQSFECAEKQENNMTSPQLSTTNEEEYSA